MVRPSGVFVTGTDTGIGKTVVSACLVKAWNAAYWKPVQTGLAEDGGDTQTVTLLAQPAPERLFRPVYALLAPLSPHEAAARENVDIVLDKLVLPRSAAPIIVEGAGGLMVPLNARSYMIDLIAQLSLPVILVARSTLGTINHTLLSLSALRARGLPVAGVVLNGPLNAGNRAAIETYGEVTVIAELPPQSLLNAQTLENLARLFPPIEAIPA